jgi:hypothetical protein
MKGALLTRVGLELALVPLPLTTRIRCLMTGVTFPEIHLRIIISGSLSPAYLQTHMRGNRESGGFGEIIKLGSERC